VRRDDVPASVRGPLDGRLERPILERLDLAAVVAHEMVVVIAVGVSRLEPCHAVSEVDPLNETELVQAVQRAVDARDPDPAASPAHPIVDLLRREAAVLLAQQLHDESSCAPASPARRTEPGERGLRPRRRHDDNDTRSQRRATVAAMRALFLVLAVVVLGGCADGQRPGDSFVVASFYPLAWATEQLAGASVDEVVNLTPPGVEPHDIELTPSDVETIRAAKLVVYIGGGFQPAVEDAVADREGRSLDVLDGTSDPHIWLDPVRFASAVEDIAAALGAPASARKTKRQLERLDAEYREGLAECDRRVLVTTHAAFGQLANRYGLAQLSLAGRSPESEPGPRELEKLVDEVRASGATTVFSEPLVSDRLARTVAREAGVDVATLDPIEGLSEERLAAGEDYLSVMRTNLATLREALGCR
jgi:zinc transport system substrate-binding protein